MRNLEDIIDDFEETRKSYRDFTKLDGNNKETLMEFQSRFVDIKSDLRYWRAKVMSQYTLRDEKSCTAIKFRIAVAMVRDEYQFADDEKAMYEKAPSIANAEKFASATRQYKQFVEQRAFAKESLANVSDLRDDCSSYLMEIRDRLK
jgi:hypothetical protein